MSCPDLELGGPGHDVVWQFRQLHGESGSLVGLWPETLPVLTSLPQPPVFTGCLCYEGHGTERGAGAAAGEKPNSSLSVFTLLFATLAV